MAIKFFKSDSEISTTSNLNPHYRHIRDDSDTELRDFIEDMFVVSQKFALDDPKKTRDEAANGIALHDTLWELILLNSMYKNGVDIIDRTAARKMIVGNSPPDFMIDIDGPIIVEATCPKVGSAAEPIHIRPYKSGKGYGFSTDNRHKESAVDRINNSLVRKYRKYQHEEYPIIVGVNSYDFEKYLVGSEYGRWSEGMQSVYGIHTDVGELAGRTWTEVKPTLYGGIVINRFQSGGLENMIGLVYCTTLPINAKDIVNGVKMEFIQNITARPKFNSYSLGFMSVTKYDLELKMAYKCSPHPPQ